MQVLDLVKRLAEQGLAVVLISHNLQDIFEVANRITVLRLGRDVGVFERAQTTQQEVVQAITAGIPDEGRRHARGRALDVSPDVDVDVAAPDVAQPEVQEEAAEKGLGRRAWDNLRQGNLGILPIVVGLVLIVIFFTVKTPVFFTANNFNNIIIQTAGTCMLAYGVVFVLLLGEIDLSIGYLSGLAAVTVAELQLPGVGTTTGPSRSSRR